MQYNLNVTPTILLNFGGTAQKEIMDFHICVGISFKSSTRVVSNLGHERSVLAFFHMILHCTFICCATCTVLLLDFSELHKWRQDFQSVCAP